MTTVAKKKYMISKMTCRFRRLEAYFNAGSLLALLTQLCYFTMTNYFSLDFFNKYDFQRFLRLSCFIDRLGPVSDKI